MIYLVQTDTTVGFLSPVVSELSKVKQRSQKNPFLITTTSFKTLHNLSRTPKKYKKLVRRAKKTTFIYPNQKAIRVVKDRVHSKFLKKFDYLYSSSANKTKESFKEPYARKSADIVVEDSRGFFESSPSSLIKLGKKTLKKLR